MKYLKRGKHTQGSTKNEVVKDYILEDATYIPLSNNLHAVLWNWVKFL